MELVRKEMPHVYAHFARVSDLCQPRANLESAMKPIGVKEALASGRSATPSDSYISAMTGYMFSNEAHGGPPNFKTPNHPCTITMCKACKAEPSSLSLKLFGVLVPQSSGALASVYDPAEQIAPHMAVLDTNLLLGKVVTPVAERRKKVTKRFMEVCRDFQDQCPENVFGEIPKLEGWEKALHADCKFALRGTTRTKVPPQHIKDVEYKWPHLQ